MTDLYPQKRKGGLTKKAKTGLIVLCFVILAAIAGAVIQIAALGNGGSFITPVPLKHGSRLFLPEKMRQSARRFSSFSFDNYIAVLHVEGVIEDSGETYNQNWILDTIDDLAGDKKNRGILLYIDSPGGGVYQSDEVYLALEDYKHNTGNKVWAYMGPLAASGGYYIACAADVIYANRNTLTGSIGVISATSVDLTELMKKYGIKMTTVTAGKNKNMLNIDSPMTEEHRAIMQGIADEAYDQFTDIVSQSRNMKIEKVRALADGRIYTAAQAEANGLIDCVDTYENAVDNMLDAIEDDEDVSVKHFRFERKKTVSDYLYRGASFFAKKSGIEAELADSVKRVSGIPEDLPLPAYYYRHR